MKIKKLLFLSILLLIVYVFMPNTVEATIGEVFGNGDFKYKVLTEDDIQGNTVEITGYAGTEAEVTIPTYVTNDINNIKYIVKTIGSNAFEFNSTMTTLKFEENSNLEKIKSNCFYGCSELTSVYLPDSLLAFEGLNAFANCIKLTTVNLPDSLVKLGRSTFLGCTSLKEITIPEGITELADNFERCSGLEKILIKGSLTSLGHYSFAECKNLTEITFEKPYSITYIGNSLFAGCQQFDFGNFYIPEGTTSIGIGAFSYCKKLENVVLPESVEKISYRAFQGCSKLRKLVVANKNCEIADEVLDSCSGELVVYGYADSSIKNYVGNTYTFKEIHKVTNSLMNITSDGLGYAHKDLGDYMTTLVANDGYELPKNISIKVNGFNLSSDEYEYNSENGNLKINAKKIGGNIEIEAFGEKIIKVSFDGNGGVFSGKTEIIEYDNVKNCDFSSLAIPTRDGYKFIGYSTNNGKSIDDIMISEEGFVEDTIFYAQWEKIYTYTFIVGGNQTFTLNKIDKYSFEIDGDYKLFSKLMISNLNLEKDIDFKVTEGSTIITFTEIGLAKLNTLAVGNYDVVVEYTNDKKVTGKLIIEADKTSEDNKDDNTDNTHSGNTNTNNTNTDNTNTNKPTGNNPKTSDNITLFVIILAVSIIGLTATTRKRKILKNN